MEKNRNCWGRTSRGLGSQYLRQNGYSGEIHVVSNEDQVFYERPPLSKQVLSKKQVMKA
jgi:hypothetical protein